MHTTAYFFKAIATPAGKLTLVAHADRLVAVLWENDKPNRVKLGPLQPGGSQPVLLEARKQLDEYFSGQRTEFDLPLGFVGTPFQKQVWNALLTIPYGETRSYLQIATQIGNPKACRAVGAANGKTLFPSLLPVIAWWEHPAH